MQFIFLLSNLDGLRLAIENFLKSAKTNCVWFAWKNIRDRNLHFDERGAESFDPQMRVFLPAKKKENRSARNSISICKTLGKDWSCKLQIHCCHFQKCWRILDRNGCRKFYVTRQLHFDSNCTSEFVQHCANCFHECFFKQTKHNLFLRISGNSL